MGDIGVIGYVGFRNTQVRGTIGNSHPFSQHRTARHLLSPGPPFHNRSKMLLL